MANTILKFRAPTGLTLTVDLFPLNSDTETASAKAATEETNRKGVYLATISEAAVGQFDAIIKNGGVAIGRFVTETMADDTNQYECLEPGAVQAMKANVLTADAAASDFIGAAEIAASASAEIADLIAQDWIAGDASPLAIAAAVRTNFATELSRIDATISSRNSTSNFTSVTNGILSSLSTIIEKLGGWSATGGGATNSILHAFQSLLRKDVAAPTDIGGTFNPATDSVEALSEAVALLSGSGGSGARTFTVTVDDGTDPLESAKVRYTKGVDTFVLSTDASGEAEFSLDDGTWTVAITLFGYTFASTTLVISASTPGSPPTYSMTPVIPAPPADPNLATLTIKCLDETGAVESGVDVKIWIKDPGALVGYAFDETPITETSDGSGLCSFSVVQGANYYVQRNNGQAVARKIPTGSSSATLTSFAGD